MEKLKILIPTDFSVQAEFAYLMVKKIEEGLPSKTLLLDLKNVIYIDTSGMDTIMELTLLCKRRNIQLIICGLDHQPLGMAERSGYLKMLSKDCFCPDLYSGIEIATHKSTLLK